MIVTEIYKGQGLGNQLWCYIVTRVIAKDKGYKFGIKNPNNFKCLDFLDLDFGEIVVGGTSREGGPATSLSDGIQHYYRERQITHLNGADIRIYDQNLIGVPDNTKIDGIMQDDIYIQHRKEEIRSWLKIKDEYNTQEYSKENTCIINFRGGEYVRFPDLFLPQKYWDDAIKNMRNINPDMEFIIVTDDTKTAKQFFPDFKIIHQSIGHDYSIINNAYYLILSNSSFAFFPAWLNQKVKKIIAPKYWARHNISDGYWSCGYNIVQNFTYQDRNGSLFNYDSCVTEFNQYIKDNISYFENYKNVNNIYELSSYSHKNNIFKVIYQNISKYIPHNIKNIIILGIRKITKLLKRVIISIFITIKRIWNGILIRTKTFLYRNYSKMRSSIVNKKYGNKSSKDLLKYKKNIKIYDIFSFFNELDLLEIRLNILGPYVDFFVIIEANVTFSGLPKPLYYKENEERFSKWKNKIIYYTITDMPNNEEELHERLLNKEISTVERKIIQNTLSSKNIPKGQVNWLRDFYQKESAQKILDELRLRDNDICFVSDLDEIWNPESRIDYRMDGIFKLKQKVYSYYLNNRSSEYWDSAFVTKYKNLKNGCLNHIRSNMKPSYLYINKGGWHFTNQGGLEKIKEKIQSYSHQEFNNENIIMKVENQLSENKDFVGRNFKFWVDENELPKYLLENKKKYSKFFK